MPLDDSSLFQLSPRLQKATPACIFSLRIYQDICKSQIGKSKRYLTKDMSGGRYVDEWKLVIPENIYNMKNGVIEDATI